MITIYFTKDKQEYPQPETEFKGVLEKVIDYMLFMPVGAYIQAGDPNGYSVTITRTQKGKFSVVGIIPGETQTHKNLVMTQAFPMFVVLFPIVWNRHDPTYGKGTWRDELTK